MALKEIGRLTEFYDTKANIIALAAALDEIRFAYATDTGELGAYVGGAWVWFGGSGGGGVTVTTKGDLQGYDTAPARVPVGADGLVLTADSGDPLGVSWQPGGSGSSMWFNVVDYGAVGDFSTVNTAALQAAIDAAHANEGGLGGVAYFPAGTYLTGGLTWYRNVALMGDGFGASSMVANAAGSLLTVASSSGNYAGYIQDLSLYGNGAGTNGIDIVDGFSLTLRRCIVATFTGIAIKMRGVLLTQFYDCVISQNATGLDADSHGGLSPNVLRLVNTTMNENTSWAIHVDHGALISLQACDLEVNGTTANAATGTIYLKPGSDGDVGLSMHDTWLEQNKGGVIVYIDAPRGSNEVFHEIANCVFQLNANATYGIRVVGSGTANTVTCRNLPFSNNAATADFYANGAAATIWKDQCTGTDLTSGGGLITSHSGGSGTLTQVDTGTGLTGGPINTTGTIDLADTAVTPGSYTYLSATVDQQGRLTAASSGTAPSNTVYAPLVNGDLPGPTPIATADGQFIMVPVS